MPDDTARALFAGQAPRSRRRPLSRIARADALELARITGTSAAARALGIPRRTLGGFKARHAARTPRSPVEAVLSGPQGARALHRIVLAALFVFGVVGGAGADTLRRFFVLAGIAPLVACSPSTLRRTLGTMVHALGDWGDATGKALGDAVRAGPERLLSLALDETWKRSMILVAMDVASGFILAEAHATARDAATWSATMTKALGALPVKVVQAVADEAKGIAAYVAAQVGVHRGSDLFHGLYELGPVLRALHAKHAEVEAAPSTGSERTNALRRLRHRIEIVREGMGALSDTMHPFNLRTGARVEPTAMRAAMEQWLARIRYAASESGLSASARARIGKVLRLVPTWVESLAWWQRFEATQRAALALPAALDAVVGEVLVPWAYLSRCRERATSAAERAALKVALEALSARLSSSSAWSSVTSTEQHSLREWASWVASHFVRASSCVEGRNGALSLRYHHRRALPPAVLKALTVVHNYGLRRPDGTTAAERLFGLRHADPFEHLVEVITPLPLPRRRAA